MAPDRLHTIGIVKRFGDVVANAGIDFELAAGEVHGVLGENGAGKSTFVNVLSGLYRQDEGEIRIDGDSIAFRSPRDAIAHGIGTVHQHFMLIPALSVGDNVRLSAVASVANWRRVKRHSNEAISQFAAEHGLAIPVGDRVAGLSLAMKQRVEIVKALYWGSRILVLDEPTAVLTPSQIETLLSHVRTIASAGCSVIFITHKLEEVRQFCDRVTVFRRGRVVAKRPIGDVTTKELAELMVGRALAERRPQAARTVGQPAVQARGLTVHDNRGHPAVNALDLTVHEGEIVGIAAVEGNGEVELAEALYGVRRTVAGEIQLRGEDVTRLTVADRQRRGLRSVPQDRREEGLVLDFSILENIALEDPHLQRGWLRPIRMKKLRTAAEKLVDEYDIRAPGPELRARNLSGGNQQKVVLARVLASEPRFLIAVHPFRGLDVGAASFVRNSLLAARERGTGILFISPDLDEILSLSDTIAVLYRGRIVKTLPASSAERHEVGQLMLGAAARPCRPRCGPSPSLRDCCRGASAYPGIGAGETSSTTARRSGRCPCRGSRFAAVPARRTPASGSRGPALWDGAVGNRYNFGSR